MNYSRRKIYSLGETLAESITSRRHGGGYVCGDGGGGSSSSSSSSATTTNNTDKRQTLQSGVGISADGSTLNVTAQTADPGVMQSAMQAVTANNALMGQAMTANDAMMGQGFTQLLTVADKLFTGAGQVVSKQADSGLAQVAALSTAKNDAAGTLDQKTIVLLAAAGAVVLVGLGRK